MKDFNEMLKRNKNMPKIVIINDSKTILRYGGDKMFIAPPLFYDALIKRIPKGKIILASDIRAFLAKENGADFTDPMTSGIFISLVAMASNERSEEITPYWRCLKANGELNEKYPLGAEGQKELLEKEGVEVIRKGKKFFVNDYLKYLYHLEEEK